MNVPEKTKLEALSGLFDYEGYNQIIADLVDVTGLPREDVLEKMVAEFSKIGSNVVADAKRFQIDPHVFNSKMEEFYKRTNAFLFELLVTHQSSSCRQIDERIMMELLRRSEISAKKKILVLGDGIGSDSLRFSRLGFDVTYFEFKGYSSSLASKRFARQNAEIKQINDLDKIPLNTFDFVVCREVLEHVQDPPSVIAAIHSYLLDDGYAIITESFDRVNPDFPTHLESNLVYAGKTMSMFIEAGFKYAGKIDEDRPFLFQKTQAPINNRTASIPRRSLFSLAARKIAFTILRKTQ